MGVLLSDGVFKDPLGNIFEIDAGVTDWLAGYPRAGDEVLVFQGSSWKSGYFTSQFNDVLGVEILHTL